MKPRENLLRAILRNSPEWVPYGAEGGTMINPPVVERPGAAGPDAFGCQWAIEEGAHGGTYPAPGGHPLKDGLDHWKDNTTIPRVDRMDWGAVAVQAAKIDRNEFLVMGFVEFSLFERSWLLLGMEEALVCYLTRPEEMYELVGAIADYKIELIGRFHETAKLDMVWFGDDWGTQRGLFIPPAIWRAVIKPHQKRCYDFMHARGLLIDQHSCGRIEEIFADLVEIGADMWNPCQPCNDLAGLKRKFGDRISFSGGIDSQFVLNRPGVTEAEVRAEVRKRISEMAPGGGYIATPSHSVPYDPKILAAMEDEIRTFGRQIYAPITAKGKKLPNES